MQVRKHTTLKTISTLSHFPTRTGVIFAAVILILFCVASAYTHLKKDVMGINPPLCGVTAYAKRRSIEKRRARRGEGGYPGARRGVGPGGDGARGGQRQGPAARGQQQRGRRQKKLFIWAAGPTLGESWEAHWAA